jgi:hypothetical protein
VLCLGLKTDEVVEAVVFQYSQVAVRIEDLAQNRNYLVSRTDISILKAEFLWSQEIRQSAIQMSERRSHYEPSSLNPIKRVSVDVRNE